MSIFIAKVRDVILVNINKSVRYNDTTKTWSLYTRKPLRAVVDELQPLGLTITRKLKRDLEDVIEIHNEDVGVNSKITSAQMVQRAENCAASMQGYGLELGDVVVIVSQMSKDITPILIACLLIGTVFSICHVDGEENFEEMLNQLKPKAIFYDDRFRRNILEVIDKDELKMFYTLGTESDSVSKNLFQGSNKELLRLQLGASNAGTPACKFFSKGKLVTLSQGQIRKAITNWKSFRKDDVVLIGCSISKVDHLTLIFTTILHGVTRVETGFAVNEEVYCDIIRRHRVTRFYSCVTVIRSMLILLKEVPIFEGCLSSLKTIISFHEYFPNKLETLIHNYLPRCRILSTYGVAEVASVLAVSDSIISGKVFNGGRIQSNMFYRILDHHDMHEKGPNENGVLCIKPMCNLEGFDCTEDQSIDKETENRNQKVVTKDGWLLTGDYARISLNGVLEVHGKCSRMILCDGILIIPSKIEEIANSHEKVEVSCCIGVPNPTLNQVPIVCIILNKKSRKSESRLQKIERSVKLFILSKVDEGAHIERVLALEFFPRTSEGKVDVRRIEKNLIKNM